jgi:Flp pilus assembly protein TadG
MKPVAKPGFGLTPAALMRRALPRAFRRDEHGAVAVEFAFLALPFFAIIGAILETSIFFLSSQVLDSAVDTSSRLVRTGQAQVQNYTAENFNKAICDNAYGLIDCEKLEIQVKTVSSFSAATFSSPLDPDTMDWSDEWKAAMAVNNGFTPGEGSQIVMVSVYYKWPTMLDILGFNLSNAGDNYRLMGAVRVFRNEPF